MTTSGGSPSLVLEAVSTALTMWSRGASPSAVFEHVLAAALSATGSEHGVVADVVEGHEGPSSCLWASSLPSDEPASAAETEHVRAALHAALRSLGRPDPHAEPAVVELEPTHFEGGPPIRVLRLLLRSPQGLVGVMALASRRQRFDEGLDDVLQPLLSACAGFIVLARAPRALAAGIPKHDDHHRMIVEDSPDGIITITHEGTIESINPAGERMFGYPSGELVGQPLSVLMPESMRSEYEGYLRNYLATGLETTGIRQQLMARRQDGSTFPMDLRVSESRLHERPLFTGFVRDISRRRAMQEALRKSEERYRIFIEHSLQGVFVDVDGVIRVANPALARMYGYADPAELVGQPYWIFLHPEERERIDGYRQARLQGGDVPAVYETLHVARDGSSMWVEVAATVIPWDSGKAVMTTCVDRTSSHRAQEALQASQHRLALAVGGADLGVWDWNFQTGELVVNEQWTAMLDYDSSEIHLNGREWERLVHPDDLPAVRRALQDHMDGRAESYLIEHRLRTKAGDWKWVLNHGRVFRRAESGAPLRAVGILQDISPRKEAELALRKSHNDLAAVLNQLRVAVAVTDADERIAFLSERCTGIEGIDVPEALGRRWQAVIPFDDRSRDQVRKAMRLPAEQRTRLTLRIETSSGRVHLLECDVGDDPRDAAQRILYLYDVTETRLLRERLDLTGFGEMVGASDAMRRLFETIQRVATGEWTVLIEGETGVGKELVARAIHSISDRRHGPFVAVNCAGLSESLLASQLFGHRKGAFTGAVADQDGLFEAATGGSIFLDEIGDVPPATQTALLRVLEQREILRIGESRPRKVDVRVLTATHHDLAREVAAGRFRNDLLYRVRVARITVPPLRDRRDDIPLLVSAFLAKSRLSAGKAVASVREDAMTVLEQYLWPGNVRELRHALDYAVIHCRGPVIRPDDLPPEIVDPPRAPAAPALAEETGTDVDERTRILAALARVRGNRTQAAKLLKMSRATFYRRLTELGLTDTS